MDEHQGGCHCGKFRFTTCGVPLLVAWCHCASCRRQTGAPAACYVDFDVSQVRFATPPDHFASSPGISRGFCAVCGTPLSFSSATEPNKICLHIGSFDDPTVFRPTAESFPAERLPWMAPPVF